MLKCLRSIAAITLVPLQMYASWPVYGYDLISLSVCNDSNFPIEALSLRPISETRVIVDSPRVKAARFLKAVIFKTTQFHNDRVEPFLKSLDQLWTPPEWLRWMLCFMPGGILLAVELKEEQHALIEKFIAQDPWEKLNPGQKILINLFLKGFSVSEIAQRVSPQSTPKAVQTLILNTTGLPDVKDHGELALARTAAYASNRIIDAPPASLVRLSVQWFNTLGPADKMLAQEFWEDLRPSRDLSGDLSETSEANFNFLVSAQEIPGWDLSPRLSMTILAWAQRYHRLPRNVELILVQHSTTTSNRDKKLGAKPNKDDRLSQLYAVFAANLSKAIKQQLRNDQDLTIDQLARKIGLYASQLQRYCNRMDLCQVPSREHLESMAYVLGKKVGILFPHFAEALKLRAQAHRGRGRRKSPFSKKSPISNVMQIPHGDEVAACKWLSAATTTTEDIRKLFGETRVVSAEAIIRYKEKVGGFSSLAEFQEHSSDAGIVPQATAVVRKEIKYLFNFKQSSRTEQQTFSKLSNHEFLVLSSLYDFPRSSIGVLQIRTKLSFEELVTVLEELYDYGLIRYFTHRHNGVDHFRLVDHGYVAVEKHRLLVAS